MVKRAHYYANRGEFGKAWAAFSPSAPADGRDPKVVANYLGKTPQARAPPASVTADEPGAARYDLKRKSFNKFAKNVAWGNARAGTSQPPAAPHRSPTAAATATASAVHSRPTTLAGERCD